jgi:hypothetical protein
MRQYYIDVIKKGCTKINDLTLQLQFCIHLKCFQCCVICIICFQSQYNVYFSVRSSLLPLVEQQFIPTITVSAVYNELF